MATIPLLFCVLCRESVLRGASYHMFSVVTGDTKNLPPHPQFLSLLTIFTFLEKKFDGKISENYLPGEAAD